MKKQQIRAKVNGEYKDILFDTTKLFDFVEQYISEYEFDYDRLENCEPVDADEVFGQNVSLTIKPMHVDCRRGGGCETYLVDFDVEIYLYNPLTDNQIVIEKSLKDCEFEGAIYDYYSYYGVSQRDFL